MVRMTIFSAVFSLMSFAAWANQDVPIENNFEAQAILDSADQPVSPQVLQTLPKSFKCGEAQLDTRATSDISGSSRDARYVYFKMNQRGRYDTFRVSVDDVRDLNNDRVKQIHATEISGFDFHGRFLQIEDITCAKTI